MKDSWLRQPYLNIIITSSVLAFFVALPSVGACWALLIALWAPVGVFCVIGLIASCIHYFCHSQ